MSNHKHPAGPAQIARLFVCLAAIVHAGLVLAQADGAPPTPPPAVGLPAPSPSLVVPTSVLVYFVNHPGIVTSIPAPTADGSGPQYVLSFPNPSKHDYPPAVLDWLKANNLVADGTGPAQGAVTPAGQNFVNYYIDPLVTNQEAGAKLASVQAGMVVLQNMGAPLTPEAKLANQNSINDLQNAINANNKVLQDFGTQQRQSRQSSTDSLGAAAGAELGALGAGVAASAAPATGESGSQPDLFVEGNIAGNGGIYDGVNDAAVDVSELQALVAALTADLADAATISEVGGALSNPDPVTVATLQPIYQNYSVNQNGTVQTLDLFPQMPTDVMTVPSSQIQTPSAQIQTPSAVMTSLDLQPALCGR